MKTINAVQNCLSTVDVYKFQGHITCLVVCMFKFAPNKIEVYYRVYRVSVPIASLFSNKVKLTLITPFNRIVAEGY